MWSSILCAFAWGCLVTGLLMQRFQLVHFGVALGLFTVGILLAFIAGVGSLWSLKTSPLAWFVLVLGFLPLLAVAIWVGPGLRGPAIHDIATSPGALSFERALELRGPNSNAVGGPSTEIIDQQRSAYPDISPLLLPESNQALVFDAAVAQAKLMGWTVTLVTAPKYFEAYEKTTLFGFIDDVKVQVVQTGADIQVDMRSISRVGRSDLGANAERIRTFLTSLENRVSQ